MPKIIYGTAWKEARTKDLVVTAVKHGFRGIDTACQPKHYKEPLVGDALEELERCGYSRKDLFIQTKFTQVRGQDPSNIPYDPTLPLQQQVKQSVAKSLANLKTTYIDSLVLHSPMHSHGETMLVWKTLEAEVAAGVVRQLGVSNLYSLGELKKLWNDAEVKPAVLQNRFYADSNYDRSLREFCREKGILYQSFWTLTANRHVLHSKELLRIAAHVERTPEQVFFQFVQQLGIVPLTGTCNEEHMKQDLETLSLSPLSDADMSTIDGLLI